MQEKIKKNLKQIQEDIAPYKPNIIAVTKYFDESAIISAFDVGMRDFAESRVIEATEKIKNLPDSVKKESKFHFIGHLQSNKVKKAVENFDYIHSVDSVKIAKSISDEAFKIGKTQKILLEVNVANEKQKFGFSKQEIFDQFTEVMNLESVEIDGLMCMMPLNASEDELNRLFAEISQIRKNLETRFGIRLKELSMGMSQDYKIAVKYGATMLRIGRKLFK